MPAQHVSPALRYGCGPKPLHSYAGAHQSDNRRTLFLPRVKKSITAPQGRPPQGLYFQHNTRRVPKAEGFSKVRLRMYHGEAHPLFLHEAAVAFGKFRLDKVLKYLVAIVKKLWKINNLCKIHVVKTNIQFGLECHEKPPALGLMAQVVVLGLWNFIAPLGVF